MGRILGRGFPVQPKYGSTDHTTRFADNFNRADGDVGAQYDTVTGFDPMYVVSNQAYGLDSVGGRSLSTVKASVATFSADHEATATLTTVTNFDFLWLVVRADAVSANFYSIAVDGLNRRLQRWTSGVATEISSKNIAVVSGDVVTLRALGTTISVWVNGVLQDAVSDATHTTGQPGFGYDYQNNRSSRIDNFSAADVTGLTTVVHQIASSGGDYTSLFAWEAAQQRDLTAAKAVAIAECQAFVDTTAVTIDGWTTDATQYIEVRATSAAAAKLPFSVAGTSAYVLRSTAAAVLTVNESYTKIRRLQVQTQSTSGSSAIRTTSGVAATEVLIDSCVVAGIKHTDVNQIHYGVEHLASSVLYVVNCVALNMTTANTNSSGFRSNTTGGTMHVYNCTSIGSGAGSGFKRDDGSIVVKNSLAGGLLTAGFSGFFNANSTNNATVDSSAYGSNPRTLQTFTFADPKAEDYRLSWEDGGARGFGTNLSADAVYPFTTDFNGRTRSTWDIGASNAPVGVVSSVASSGGDYTSLSAWEAAQQRDLVTGYQVAVAACSAFQDTTQLTIDGWTTDSACHVIVRPAAGAEARLPWSTSSYRLVVGVGAGSNALLVSEQYTRIERIQLQITTVGQDTSFGYTAIQLASGLTAIGTIIDGCHVRANASNWVAGSTGLTGFNAGPDINGNLYVRNTVFADFTYATPTNARGIQVVNHASGKTYVHNCTVVNTGRCIWDGYGDMVIRNTLVVPAAGGAGFYLSFDAATNYNASSDTTAVGANSRISQTFTFADYAGGDYRLSAMDVGAQGFGTDLSTNTPLAVTRDFSGYTRAGAWDIGASHAPETISHTVRASGGDYTTIAAWEAAQQRDLITGNQIARAAVGAFADSSTNLTISGWTADTTHHIIVEAENTAAKAKLPWDPAAYIISMTGGGATINVDSGRPRFVGLQVLVPAYGFNFDQRGIVGTSRFEVDSCVIRYQGHASNNGYAEGIASFDQGYSVKNTVVMNFDGTGGGTGRTAFQNAGVTGNRVVYNCTVINCQTGFNGAFSYADLVVKNCLVDRRGLAGAVGFTGTYTAGTSNNASDDATAPGTSSRTSQTFSFANSSVGDYRLAYDDTGARTFGVNLSADSSYAVVGDLAGNGRTGSWDIGASEAPTAVIHQIASSGGDYTSLSAWEAAQQRNVVTVNEAAIAECQAFADTTAVTIDGWTSDAQRPIEVRAAAGAAAQMPWSAAAYRLSVDTTNSALTTNESSVKIKNIQIENISTNPVAGNNGCVTITNTAPAGVVEFTGLLVRKLNGFRAGNNANANIYATCAPGVTTVTTNCVSIGNQTGYIAQSTEGAGITHIAYNNTVVNANGSGYFITGYGATDAMYFKNNLAYNCAEDFHRESTWTTEAFANNASEDATAPANTVGGGTLRNRTFTFVNAAGGDYHLARADVGAQRVGASLTGDAYFSVTTDFDRVTRRAVNWDIGADQLVDSVIADSTGYTIGGTDATLTFTGGGGGDTRTLNHTAGATADITLGAVFVVAADVDPTVTATYNGSAMASVNEIDDSGNDYHLELFSIQPTTAPEVVFSSTTSAGLIKAMVAVSYDAVPATAGVRSSVTATGTDDSPTATATDVALNDKVVAFISWYGSGSIVADSASGEYLVSHTFAGNHHLAVIEKPGTNTTVTFNPILGSAAPWQMVVAAVKSTVSVGYTLTAEVGTYAVTGTAADLEQGYEVEAEVGTYALTGTDASLERGFLLAADPAPFVVTGTDASLEKGQEVGGEAGAYVLTGTDATLRKTYRLVADSTTYAFTGTDATLIHDAPNQVLVAESGTYVVTGTAANLEKAAIVGADTVAYAFTGTDASLKKGSRVAADTVAYALTGTLADLEKGSEVAADTVAYAVTGTAASLEKGFKLVADSGVYALTGTDATLIGPAGILAAESGTFVVTGEANLERGTRLVADTAAYALAGTAASLEKGFEVTADTVAYAFTGSDAFFRHSRVVAADTVAYSVTGVAANLEKGYRVTADTAAYAVTGTDANLEQGYEVAADTVAYAIAGTAASLEKGFKLTADSGNYALTGTDATFRHNRVLAATTTLFTWTGSEAILSTSPTLNAEGTAFVVAAPQTALRKTYRLVADAVAYTSTGTAASLEKGFEVAGDTGAYALTGSAANLERGTRVAADTANYALTGSSANLLLGRRASADSGTYVFTGSDAALGSNPTLNAEAAAYVLAGAVANLRRTVRLVAEAGTYVETGTAANLEQGYEVAADTVAYTLTGSEATLKKGFYVLAQTTAIAVTGTAASTLANRRVGADTGAYVETGTAASLEKGYRLSGDTANYAVTGTDAEKRKQYMLEASPVTWTVDAPIATNLLSARILRADTDDYLFTGEDAYLGPVKSWTLTADPGDVDFLGLPAGLVYTPYSVLDLGTFELYETLETVGTVTIAPQDEYVLKAVPAASTQLVGGTIIAPDQTITLIVSDPKARTLTKALQAMSLVIVG